MCGVVLHGISVLRMTARNHYDRCHGRSQHERELLWRTASRLLTAHACHHMML